MDLSILPAKRRIAAEGRAMVTIGLSAEPLTRAVLVSAGPSGRPRSDGLIGVASMRTTT
jgi:hypothetical protein